MSAIRAVTCSLGLLLALLGLGAATAVPAGAQLAQSRHSSLSEGSAETSTSVGYARTPFAVAERASGAVLGPVVDRRSGTDAVTPDPGDLPDTGPLTTRDGWLLVGYESADHDGALAILPASRAPPALVA